MSAWATVGAGVLQPSFGHAFNISVSNFAYSHQETAVVYYTGPIGQTSEASAQTMMANLFPLPRPNIFLQGRRNKLEIYAEILKRLLNEPLGITEIALFCRLNFSSAKEMVDYLVSKGLLELVVVGQASKYKTSEKGIDLLGTMEDVVAQVLRSS